MGNAASEILKCSVTQLFLSMCSFSGIQQHRRPARGSVWSVGLCPRKPGSKSPLGHEGVRVNPGWSLSISSSITRGFNIRLKGAEGTPELPGGSVGYEWKRLLTVNKILSNHFPFQARVLRIQKMEESFSKTVIETTLAHKGDSQKRGAGWSLEGRMARGG